MKAAIFARVSTQEQALRGFSLPDQVAVCRKKAEELGCIQIDEFIEDESGAFMETPGLDILRDAVKNNGYKYVVMLDPDRLARNLTRQLVVANEIEHSGAELVFTNYDYDKSAEGRLFFNLKGALSEYEREKIKERTSRGMRRKALSGKVPKSGRPYGYDYNSEAGMYVINEDEAQAVRLMFKWIGQEKATLYETCRRLAEMGVQTKNNGGVWRTNTVAGIIHNTLYFGEAVAFKKIKRKIAPHKYKTGQHPKDNWVIIPVPAIITREEFEAAQATLRENYEKAPRNTKNPYLLQGLVYCPVCKKHMGICYDGKVTMAYFFCRTGTRSDNREPRSPKCGVRMVPMLKLEASVSELLSFFASNSDKLKEYLSRENINEESQDMSGLLSYLEKLKNKQDTFSNERNSVTRLFRKKLITEDDVERQLSEIAREEEETKAQIEAINIKVKRVSRQDDDMDGFIQRFVDGMIDIEKAPYFSKKHLIETYVNKIFPRRMDKANNTKFCQLEIDIDFRV